MYTFALVTNGGNAMTEIGATGRPLGEKKLLDDEIKGTERKRWSFVLVGMRIILAVELATNSFFQPKRVGPTYCLLYVLLCISAQSKEDGLE